MASTDPEKSGINSENRWWKRESGTATARRLSHRGSRAKVLRAIENSLGTKPCGAPKKTHQKEQVHEVKGSFFRETFVS
jgi:hypothetical protein